MGNFKCISKEDFYKKSIEAYYKTQEYKNGNYPDRFELTEVRTGIVTKRTFKLVKIYSNYARYKDEKTNIFEFYSKIDFLENANIKILIKY